MADEVGHEARPSGGGEVAAGEPGVGVDHVGGHQCVLEVEHGEVSVGGQIARRCRSGRLSTTDLPGLVRTRVCSSTEGRWISCT